MATKRQGIALSVRELRMSHCLANQHLAEDQQYTIPDIIPVLVGTEPSENLTRLAAPQILIPIPVGNQLKPQLQQRTSVASAN